MKKRRLLAGILAFAMAFSSISYTAFADESASEAAVEEAVTSDSALEAEPSADGVSDAVKSADVQTEDDEAADLAFDDHKGADQIVALGGWQGTIFGNSVVGDNDSIDVAYINAESDSDVWIGSKKGKISDTQDGLAFYYQQVSADEDFTLSATATVESYANHNQVAFGLRMSDILVPDGTDPGDGNYGASFAAGGFRVENKPTIGSLGYYRGDDGDAYVAANKSTIAPNDAAKFKPAPELTINEGSSVDIKMQYNSAVKMLTVTVAGQERTFSLEHLDKTATFADDLYVGPFVSREAVVKFSNLKLIIGNPVYTAGEWKTGKSYSGNAVDANPTIDAEGNLTNVSFSYSGTNKGKLSDNDEEYAYVVNEIDANANFTLSAHAKVDLFAGEGSNNNQSGFGIVFRSTISEDDPSYTAGSGSDRHSPSLMLSFIPDTKTLTANPDFDFKGANVRMLGYKTDAENKKVMDSSASLTNIFQGAVNTDDEYDISIKKAGTSYVFTVKNAAGNTYTQSLSDPDVFGSTIYPGFYAARNIKVSFTDIKLDIDNREVRELKITKPSNHTTYYWGEDFVADGLEITGTYFDRLTEVISEEVISPADYIASVDTSVVGPSEVKIAVGSAIITYPVTVRKMNVVRVDITSPALINRYYEYQTFTTLSLKSVAVFEDGSTMELDNAEMGEEGNAAYYVDGQAVDTNKYWRASECGKKTVGVGIKETDTLSPNNVTGNYTIDISPYKLESISVSNIPDKTYYVLNEELDTSGLGIEGIYTDGTRYAFDALSPSTYSIKDFSTAVLGEFKAKVVVNADPTKSAQFTYSVNDYVMTEASITHYPRTTYPVGYDKETMKADILGDTTITTYYNNGDSFVYTGGISVNVDSVDTSKEGTYQVIVTPNDTNISSFTFDVTVWKDSTFKWKLTKFGSSSGGSTSSIENPDANGLAEKVNLRSFDGTGKVTNSGHDGIIYYYTRVNPEHNFTISGRVEVVGYHQNNGTNIGRMGQEGFGIMARDVIPLQPKEGYGPDDLNYEGFGNEIVVKTENAKKGADGEPLSFESKGNDFSSNIVSAGGYAWNSYSKTAPFTATATLRNNSNRMKMFVRSGVNAWNGSDQAGLKNEELVADDGSTYGDYMSTEEQLLSGECFYPKTGDVYRISLSRINSGYYMSATVEAVGPGNARYEDRVVGRTFTYAYDYTVSGLQDDPLLQQNSDTIYVGFYAARYAEINVTDIDVYESDKSTDLNSASAAEERQAPGISVTSPLYTSDTEYSLGLKTSNDKGGTVIVKLDDQIIANGFIVKKGGTNLNLSLEKNKKYDLLISYTPSTKDLLTSYDTITNHYDLYCVNNTKVEGDYIYAAPIEGEGTSANGVYGSFENTGTKDNPLDINSAISSIQEGQTIVLLDGTYIIDNGTVSISDANSGYYSAYKKIMAEHPRKAVLDFARSGEGFRANGDYWWISGLVITKTAIGSSYGFELTGSNCIIENCLFADNGGTGFQVSGNSNDTFDKWPSNNLIVYCESYDSLDATGSNADGFGCKLTVGNGNIFKNCVAHNNNDDGWDLYTKKSSGPIGAVIIDGCISYDDSYYLVTENNVGNKYNGIEGTDDLGDAKSIVYNTLNPSKFKPGDKILYQAASSSGNGFKLGGEDTYVQHYIKDSYAWGNKAKGFDSNSNPAMKVRNCISYHNGIWAESSSSGRQEWTVTSKNPGTAANFGLTSGVTDKIYNYNLDGAISIAATQADQVGGWNTEGVNQAEDGNTLSQLHATENAKDSDLYPILTLHRGSDAVNVTSPTNCLVKNKSEAESADWGLMRSGNMKEVDSKEIDELLKEIDDAKGEEKKEKEAELNRLVVIEETNEVDGEQVTTKRYFRSDYYTASGYAGYNSEGEIVTPDWFADGALDESKAVNEAGFISQNSDGSYNLNGFLQLKDSHQYMYNDIDTPIYNDTYLKFFNIENPDIDSPSETTTSASSSSSTGGSGGGGGSSSRKTQNNAVTAPTTEVDNTAEETTSDSGSTPTAPTAPTAPVFTDISSRPWAVEAVNKLAALGIITGVTSTTFAPDNSLTRADFAVLVSRLLGLEAGEGAAFSDVSDTAYYADAVAALAATGIVSGYDDGTFKPTQNLSRQEMFVLVAKTYEYIGIDISADTAVLDKFSDSSDVAAWAAPYAAYLVGQGVVNGAEGKLNPAASITRAETAVLLSAVYDDVTEAFAAAEAAAAAEESSEAVEAETEGADSAEAASETTEEVSQEEASEETTEESVEAASETASETVSEEAASETAA